MKKTIRVITKHNPGELHAALAAAGVPVLTIRSDWASSDLVDVPLCSVVVFEDGYEPESPAEASKIAQKILEAASTARVSGKPIPLDPPGFDKEASLSNNEGV
jgi:hypothetical protein